MTTHEVLPESAKDAAAETLLGLLRNYKDEVPPLGPAAEADEHVEYKGRPGWFFSVIGTLENIRHAGFIADPTLIERIDEFIKVNKIVPGDAIQVVDRADQETRIKQANELIATIAYRMRRGY